MPPKGKRPSGPADAFLFVNEDFNTLFGGAKNADLDRSKQSHVQRRSFAKRRKVQGSGALTSSTSSPSYSEDAQSPAPRVPLAHLSSSSSSWLPTTEDNNTDTLPAVTRPPSPFDESTVPLWTPPSDSLLRQSTYPFAQLDHQRQSSIEPRPTLPPLPGSLTSTEMTAETENTFSLTPVNSASSTDPFDNVSVALERWAPSLMRYFTMKMVPEFFYTDLQATSLHNMRHVDSIHQDMRSCMSSPAEMYALLAASACHALSREGILDLPGLIPEDSDRVTLLFKSKAFESLRLRLSSGELSQGVVIAIQRMICAALYTSNYMALESHYRALLSMIQAIGGLEAFDDFQKERLIMHDFSYALSTRSLPRLELTWDPGELSTDVNLEVIFHTNQRDSITGERLQEIIEVPEMIVDAKVARCILELIETQQVLEWLRDEPYQPAQYRWLAHRRLAIMHRILTVKASSLSGISRLVRLALLCYLIMGRTIPVSNHALIDHYLIPELAKWNRDTMTNAFNSQTELLLWVVVMFALGSVKLEARTTDLNRSASQQSSSREEPSSRGLEDRQHFDVTTLATDIGKGACQTLDVRNEAQMRDLMKKFLFDGDFVNERYISFAQESLGLSR